MKATGRLRARATVAARARIRTGAPAPKGACSVVGIGASAERLLRERYVPASVVINSRGDILHLSGPTQDYLVRRSGLPTANVFAQVAAGVQTALRTAVREVIRHGGPVRTIPRPARGGGASRRVTITVERLDPGNEADGLILVSFLSSNQELQAANDELSTLNAQLQSNVAELTRTYADLDNLISSTNLATVFLDRRFHVRRFTTAATRLFTLIATDIGRPLTDIDRKFVDPDLLKDAHMVLEHLVPSRKEVRTADGHWYLRETLPCRTRDNRIEGVVITFSDAASDVLQDARLRAEAIVHAVHEGLIVLDASLHVVTMNPALCDIFEMEPAEIEKQSLFTIDRGALDIPALRALLECAVSREQPSDELDIRPTLTRTGERLMRVRARRLRRTADDRTHLVLLIVEDITERKRQAEALRGSEARAHAILDATADGIITTDVHGAITTWNAATERIFGYTADDALGKNVTILMPSSHDSSRRQNAIEQDDDYGGFTAWCRDHGPPIIGQSVREVVGRRKDGTTFPLDLAVSEFHDGKGPGFVGIMRDITQRKRAEDEERHHHAELARVLRVNLVGELGVSLAHEVSQPLAAIANTLEACARNIRAGKLAPEHLLELVDRATKESVRAGEIVRNLRELVRGHSLHRERVDLRRLVESAVVLVSGQLERNRIGLVLALGDAPLPILASSVEVEQVIINILQNAIDSILERGDSHRKIAISASTNSENIVEVAVRDTGAGIPLTSMTRLFEPFFTTKRTGLGMGLAICRSIVEAHGGRLWVASGEHHPGATTLRLTLPLTSEVSRLARTRTRHRR